MNIGIIVYSQTGNTLSVAHKLSEKLSAAHHQVDVKRIKVKGEIRPGMRDVSFQSIPDLRPYDAVVIASYVEAFSLSTVMTRYLEQHANLDNKKAVGLLTQGLPFKWMGGNNALRQVKKLAQQKGAEVLGEGIISWSRINRKNQIETVSNFLSQLF